MVSWPSWKPVSDKGRHPKWGPGPLGPREAKHAEAKAKWKVHMAAGRATPPPPYWTRQCYRILLLLVRSPVITLVLGEIAPAHVAIAASKRAMRIRNGTRQ